MAAAKLLIDRVIPSRRGAPVSFHIRPLKTPEDCALAVAPSRGRGSKLRAHRPVDHDAGAGQGPKPRLLADRLGADVPRTMTILQRRALRKRASVDSLSRAATDTARTSVSWPSAPRNLFAPPRNHSGMEQGYPADLD